MSKSTELLREARILLEQGSGSKVFNLISRIDAHLSSQPEAAQEGWRLVPVEPTAGMIDAACNWREQLQTIDKPSMRDQYRAFYAAMLASAPQPNETPNDRA